MARKKTVEIEETVEAVEEIEVETEKKIYKARCLVNIRKEPSMEADVVRVSNFGDEVEVDAIENGWMRLTDGTYTMAEFWAERDADY